jgi:hypothetical protein
MNYEVEKCNTMCSNCHWDFESRKQYSIKCLNCNKYFCDSCNECGTKCKKNNIECLLKPCDFEFTVRKRHGYGYDTNYDFSQCVLCTNDKNSMKVRVKDKYNLLLKTYDLKDEEIDRLTRENFYNIRSNAATLDSMLQGGEN